MIWPRFCLCLGRPARRRFYVWYSFSSMFEPCLSFPLTCVINQCPPLHYLLQSKLSAGVKIRRNYLNQSHVNRARQNALDDRVGG